MIFRKGSVKCRAIGQALSQGPRGIGRGFKHCAASLMSYIRVQESALSVINDGQIVEQQGSRVAVIFFSIKQVCQEFDLRIHGLLPGAAR